MKVPEAHALAVDMFAQHGITDWKIRWNRRTGDAGTASYRNKTVTFSALAVERYPDTEVIQLIKHEIAHILVGPGYGHGKVWRKKILELGGTAEEHCPTFSTGTERTLSDLLTPEGFYYVGLGVAGCWIAAPALAPAVTACATGWYIWQVVLNSRVLTRKDREQIEHATLNP